MRFLVTLFKGIFVFANLAILELIVVLLALGKPSILDAGQLLSVLFFWVLLMIPTFMVAMLVIIGRGALRYIHNSEHKLSVEIFAAVMGVIFLLQCGFIASLLFA